MKWKKAVFKGKKIWAAVDEKDNPVVINGLTPMRYSKSEGAKIYRGSSPVIRYSEGGSESLPEGTIQDSPRTSGKKSVSSSQKLGSAKTRTPAQRERAKQMAQDLVESFNEDAISCFTDGACKGNPGPAGCGALLQFPDGREIEHSRNLGTGTNNIAELSAILDVLKIVEEENIPDNVQLEICTDSKYVQGVLSLGWKAKSNQELIMDIKQRIKNRGNIRLHWVAGHAGIPQNERADELAVAALYL
jgi:ribonuclease HI